MSDKTARDGVRAVIQSIIDRDGEITASVLVATATPKHSPAHAGFEWDNNVAGKEYRLIQARQWLRLIPVTVQAATATPGAEAKAVQLIHVPSDTSGEREGVYKPLTVLITNPDEYQRALTETRKSFAASKRAVDLLVEATKHASGADKIALVAQLARGMDIMQEALLKM